MKWMESFYNWVWTDHGTKTIGFAQIALASVASADLIESPKILKIILMVSGFLTAIRGFINSNRAPQ